MEPKTRIKKSAKYILPLCFLASLLVSGCNLSIPKDDDGGGEKPTPTPTTINWVHYPSLDPTKTEPGIKEHYYNKRTKNFSFEEPSQQYNEGSWTQRDKDVYNAIYEQNPYDDRFIKSFNELDKIFGTHDGTTLFDNAYLNNAKKYYDENYSISAKQAYSGNLFTNLEYYENNFGEFINTEDVVIESDFDDYFEFTQSEDDSYGHVVSVTIKQNINADDISFVWKGPMIQPVSSKIESIGFAIKSTSSTYVGISIENGGQSTKLKENDYSVRSSWQTFNYKNNTLTFSYLSSFIQEGDTYFKFKVKKDTPADTVITISSFVCKSPLVPAIKEIMKLPSIDKISPFSISYLNKLKNQYASYSSDDKEAINYQKILNLIDAWNSKYVLLYDMNDATSVIGNPTNLDQMTEFEKETGYYKDVEVSDSCDHVYLQNINNVSKDAYLSSILMRVKPSEDAKLRFVDLNEYGTNKKQLPLTGGQWNDVEIDEDYADLLQDKIPYGSNKLTLDFCSTNESETSTDSFNKTNKVGFGFAVSSLIGVKSLDEDKPLMRTIRRTLDPTNLVIEDSSKLNEIEDTFNSLSSSRKERIKNIDTFYDAKVEYNKKFSYLVSPDIKCDCYQYRADGSGDIITLDYNVPTKYGEATYFKAKDFLGSGQTWLTIPFNPVVFSAEHEGSVLYAKGLRTKLSFSVGVYNNYVAQNVLGTSVGDGWLKFELTKEQTNAFLQSGKQSFYRVDEGIPQGTELYISGLYAKKPTQTLTSNFTTVQNEINELVGETHVNEYSLQQYIRIQEHINALNSYEQSKLENTNVIDNLYSLWNKTYEKAISFDVYDMGLAWNQDTTISSEVTEEYGKVYKAKGVVGNSVVLTFGLSKTTAKYDGSSNQYRGIGKALKPVELGRYKKVLFKVFNPGTENSMIKFYGIKEGDLGAPGKGDKTFNIAEFAISPGWNVLAFSNDSLNRLCGLNGDERFEYTALEVFLSNCGSSDDFILTQFIGTLDPTFTGEAYHYPTDATHINAKNQTTRDEKLFDYGASKYTIVCEESSKTRHALELFDTNLGKIMGIKLPRMSSTAYSSNGKYIFFDCYDKLSSLNVNDLPSINALGNSGYYIKTIGDSIFIQAKTADGYDLAVIRFLQEAIGFDQFSKDMFKCIKNGAELSKSFSINLPEFNLFELPDFETRYGSNLTRYYNECFSMGLNTPNNIMMKCDEFSVNSYHSLEVLLPRATYPNYYWHDDSKTGYGEPYEYQFCYTGKNYQYYDTAINILAGKIKKLSEANPDSTRVVIGQWDCNGMCTCSSCKAIRDQHGGSNSSCIIKFMNDLDDKVKETIPGKNIDLLFFAYHQSLKAPTNITDDVKLHENLIPIIAPSRARWNKSFYQEENSTPRYGYGKDSGEFYHYDNDFASIISDWKKVSNRSFMWAYQTNFTNSLYFYNSIDPMVDQYRFYRECNIATMFNEGNWIDNGSGFIFLKDYLDSKLYLDLTTPFDQIYEKFFKYFYGDAGDEMKALLQEMTNNFNYLDKRYSKGAAYNPDNTTPTDFNGKISDQLNQAKYFNGVGNPYNGGSMSSTNNLCDLTRWLNLINTALAKADNDVIGLHIKNEAIGVYILDKQIKNHNTYVDDLVRFSYEVGTHYLSEADFKEDNGAGRNWQNGTFSICYRLTNTTYKQKLGL